ncbi:MAG: hypothetical protein LBI43_06830 [Streptococcaceae bacterium]|jgi:hypothetical protein|nr:hypothetical protein [Streptococcaceae bacterium]
MANKFDKFLEDQSKEKTTKAVVQNEPRPVVTKTVSIKVSEETYKIMNLIKMATGEKYNKLMQDSVLEHFETLAKQDPKVESLRTLLDDFKTYQKVEL